MKPWKLFGATLVVLLLSACGGGGGSSGTSTSSSSTTTAANTPASIEILTSQAAVPSDGSVVKLTFVVKNASNVAVATAPVTVSASSGILQNVSTTTNDSGVGTADLTVGNDPSNRTITISATSRGASATLPLPVSGTTLTLTGNFNFQTGAAASQLTLAAKDSAGKAISGKSLTVSSRMGNLAVSTITTNTQGLATFSYSPQNPGSDTVTISGLGSVLEQAITVSADPFVVLTPEVSQSVPVGANFTVKVRYTGATPAGRPVSFAITRGGIVSASTSTDQAGEATAVVRSDQAGPATVQATISGSISAVAKRNFTFVSQTVARVTAQAQPSTIVPNQTGESSSSSEILAKVVDGFSNPVSNVAVQFNMADPSGGRLESPTAITDANGYAKVLFYPGANATATNGVQVTASASGISGAAQLTVSGKALFITIGFGNVIENYNQQMYKKTFTLYVTDSNGSAVKNQPLTVSALPSAYLQGRLCWNSKAWAPVVSGDWIANEDLNLNGMMDSGEDRNANGQLEPGNVVGINGITGGSITVTTNADGVATIDLVYGENYADWVKVNISARGVVDGTESRSSLSDVLWGLSSDYTSETITPAAVISPYGAGGAVCPKLSTSQ